MNKYNYPPGIQFVHLCVLIQLYFEGPAHTLPSLPVALPDAFLLEHKPST